MEASDEDAGLTTGQAVERAIKIAQDAVTQDELGNVQEAIALYTASVKLIKRGLQIQREEELVDTTVLHKYAKLYNDRIAELQRSLMTQVGPPGNLGVSPGRNSIQEHSESNTSAYFAFEDYELNSAEKPGVAPTGAEEWRRPFWLMRSLRASMERGAYLSPDPCLGPC